MTQSPIQSVEAAFAALDRCADPAMFITLVAREDALAAAAALEALGPAGKPLYGLTLAVKDNIDVAGLPTTAACPAFAYTPSRSAVVVDRLVAAGAIVIGKTNLDQFATGLVGVRSPYGVPRNALRADLIPGGSSSGSAVAVAGGVVDIALGTDTAGSGRIPAGLNGIVGLKPTLGLLSSTGMVPACRTLDTISIFTRSVDLARRVAEIATGYDAADAYSRQLPPPTSGGMPPKFRVGVPRPEQRLFFGDAAAEAAYVTDLDRLIGLGATVVEIDFEPLHAVAQLLYEGPWVAERFAATKPLIETSPEAFHPTTFKIIGGALGVTAISAFESIYKLADYRRAAQTLLAGIDLLAVPTVPRFYTLAEIESEPIACNSNLGAYTNFVNLLDMAAISVPAGLRGDGLPSSLTLIGPAGSDGYLAGIAQGIEGLPVDGAAATPLRAAPGQIELCVVGAHLSGLPLNKELLALGASFLRNVETVPDYSLYALPNTVPPKPGLLRTGAGGTAIAAEVWGLSPAAFGTFVAAIPSPLGIGTLRFADGTEAKGFLVEAEAVKGARDVSGYGGWRAFVAAPKSAVG